MATKWGIVSAGKICHDFVTAVRSLPPGDHEIVAVAARKLEDARAFAQLHHIKTSYGSYEELAKDPEVEVVYVGTLNSFHYPAGKLMIENGKHVLMEKPLGINLREVKELTSLAKQKKLFFMEAIWSRFLPSYEHLMKELKAGTIGEVKNVYVSFGIPISGVERVRKQELGGGSLLDIGIYCLNAICMVYQEDRPEQIKAVGHLSQEGVDESLSVSLQYSNGRLATLNTSTVVELPNEVIISGTKGTLKLAKPMWCTEQVILNGVPMDFPLPPTVLPCNFTNSSGLRYEAMEVRRCLKAGLLESCRMSNASSELLFSIMDEIRLQTGVVYAADSA